MSTSVRHTLLGEGPRGAALALLVVALVQWSCGWLGTLATSPAGVDPSVWPAAGSAIAFGLVLGARALPGVLVGATAALVFLPEAGALAWLPVPVAVAQCAVGVALRTRFGSDDEDGLQPGQLLVFAAVVCAAAGLAWVAGVAIEPTGAGDAAIIASLSPLAHAMGAALFGALLLTLACLRPMGSVGVIGLFAITAALLGRWQHAVAGDGAGAADRVAGLPVALSMAAVVALLAAGLLVQRQRAERTERRSGAAVAATRHELDELLAALPDALVIAAADGTIVRANEQAATLFGYAPGELVGLSVDRLVPVAQRRTHAAHRLASGPVIQPRAMGSGLDLRALRRDGSELDVDIRLARVTLDGLPMTAAAIRDVGDQWAVQRALLAQEARLRATLASLDGGVAVLDESHALVLWNEELLRLLAADDLTAAKGMPLLDLLRQVADRGRLGSRPAELVAARMHRLLIDAPPGGGEVRLGERTLRVSLRLASDASQILTVVDVTNDERMRASLRAQSALLEDVLSTLNQGVIAFDVNRQAVVWNERYLEMFPSVRGVLERGASMETISLKLRSSTMEPDEAALDEVRAFHDRMFEGSSEAWEYHQAGRFLDARAEASANGGVVLTFTDVTERREQEALLILRALGTRLANEALDPLDAIGRCLVAVGEQTRWDVAHAFHLPSLEGERVMRSTGYWYPQGVPSTDELRAAVLQVEVRAGEGLPGTVLATGEPYWAEDLADMSGGVRGGRFLRESGFRSALGFPVLVHGQVRAVLEFASRSHVPRDERMLGALEHIGAQIAHVYRRQEVNQELQLARTAAEAASVAKAQFLANTSHEIRTPMNAIIGLTQLALGTRLNARQRDYMTKVDRAARSLLGIINDILDFSKIEAGQLDLEHIDFSLHTVLEDLAGLCALQAEAKHLELVFAVPADVPTQLVGDPLRVGQILLNLCSNGIKFTGEGHVRVAVSVAQRTDDEVLLRFAVDDTGDGMGDEARVRLFQSFSQADASITRQYGGTGLGLAIARELVEKMQGRIGVYSEKGAGSSFWFTARFGLGTSDAAPRRVLPGQLVGRRALVVERHDAARESMVDCLHTLGVETIACADMACAIDCMAERTDGLPIGLVLLDRATASDEPAASLAQPDPSAPDVVRVIRVVAPGAGSGAVRIDGIDAQVEKPVTPSNLFAAIENAYDTGPPRAGPTGRQAEAMTSDVRGARVLVVEDNVVNQQVARDMLVAAGIAAVLVDNGQAALDLLEVDAGFDCVLMDLQMPVMDGITATRRLRTNPRFDDLPIIAMTANVMSGDRERTLAAGMQGHLGKPVERETLLAALEQWIPADRLAAEGSPKPRIADREVPFIEGFDAAAAVTRVGGRVTVWLELLGCFASDQCDVPEKIRVALDCGDTAAARTLTHTLKGVAGTVGAERVASLAAGLEVAIDHSPSAAQAALPGLAAAVAAAVERIAAHTPATEWHSAEGSDATSDEGSHAVLVVEDDPVNRDVLRRQVESLGRAVTVAADGREALRSWRVHRQTLVLTDLHMPMLDGFELHAAIRRESAPGEVRVVAVSGDLTARARCALEGMDGFVAKPTTAARLSVALGPDAVSGVPAGPVADEHRSVEAGAPEAEVQGVEPSDAEPSAARPPAADSSRARLARLDPSVLGEQFDAETVAEVHDEFVEACTQIVAALMAAVQAGDGPEVREEAHKLKSAALGVGAGVLGDLCTELEMRAAAGESAVLVGLADQVSAEFHAVCSVLEAR